MPQDLENATPGSKLVAKSVANDNRFPFTERRIEKLPLPTGEQRAYYHDTVVRGLCIAVSPLGKKTYVLYRKVNGKPERVAIGPCCDLTVEQARGEASRMNGVIAQGGNPASERRSVRAEMTLQELFDTFLALYAKERLRPVTWKNYESIFNSHLHGWKLHKLSSIRRPDVIALHARIGRTDAKHTANRVIELLSAMFNRARNDWGYDGENPAEKIEAFKERSRERFLGDADPKETARFFKALGEESDLWQDFFKTCVLTGARCSNVEAMAWTEINWQRSEWLIAAENAKEDEPIRVVLSPEALEILERRAQNSKSEWVFPSTRRSKSGHIEESKSAWKRILENAKIENLRVHDLRRTLGSWQAATGASLAVIGKSLGHADGSSATAVYARLNLDPVRASVNLATAALLAAGDAKLLEADELHSGPDSTHRP
jgi:integrase